LNCGAIDAIYAAHLALQRGTSYLTVRPLTDVALAFSYVLNRIDSGLATHSIVREMVASRTAELDTFIAKHSSSGAALHDALELCIRSLPENLQQKVALDVSESDFTQA